MTPAEKLRGTGAADRFSSLLNAEIRAEMGKQRLTLRRMEELTDISKSRLGEAINQDKAPLNTNELGRICNALRTSASVLLQRVEHVLEDEQATPAVGRFRRVPGSPYPVYEVEERPGYDLAARRRRDTPEPSEEDYF